MLSGSIISENSKNDRACSKLYVLRHSIDILPIDTEELVPWMMLVNRAPHDNRRQSNSPILDIQRSRHRLSSEATVAPRIIRTHLISPSRILL